MDAVRRVYFNGVSGVDGSYLRPPVDIDPLSTQILEQEGRRRKQAPDRAARLRELAEKRRAPQWGGPPGVRPEDYRSAGWAVVFATDERKEVRQALEPLIAHRASQVPADRCKCLEYDGGDTLQWLRAHKVGAGTWEPTRVPLYLLVVGSPEVIPLSFSQDLSFPYFIGRIDFPDAEDYARYADSVVRYETGQAGRRAHEVACFGTRHDYDGATQLSADHLVRPLAKAIDGEAGSTSKLLIDGGATRQSLSELLREEVERAPSILFSATHGLGFADDPRQAELQGALLCADWTGEHSIAREHYFAAEDVSDDANVHGLVAFLFACYSGATSEFDRYLHHEEGRVERIAAAPFFSRLPQRLLAHPRGGALACIGHVGQILGCSIQPRDPEAHIAPFQNTLRHLLAGNPIGFAIQDFRDRFVEANKVITRMFDDRAYGLEIDRFALVDEWLIRNDAEGYILMGDPAVTLRPRQVEGVELPGSGTALAATPPS